MLLITIYERKSFAQFRAFKVGDGLIAYLWHFKRGVWESFLDLSNWQHGR